MTEFEVVVVGAGPAGAELARCLAQAGVSVCLIDRLPHMAKAAFSSAALPLASIDRFGLPAELLAARWCGWQLLGPNGEWHHWQQSQALGAVLDFAALRQWLTAQVQILGGELMLGCTVTACELERSGMKLITHMRNHKAENTSIRSDWVVDASGQSRCLISEAGTNTRDPLLLGVGLEWLLEVDQNSWQRWSQRLSFLIGSNWVPNGYGWVFPMQPGCLKVGVCRLLNPNKQTGPSLGVLQKKVLGLLDLDAARVLDRHGGLIRSRVGRSDCHGRGRLLAIGDAVSTANLLGGEGIRHAMESARVLAPLLLANLAKPNNLIKSYKNKLKCQLGARWNLSGRLAQLTWQKLHTNQADQRMEKLLQGLKHCSAADLSELLFNYRFERYGLRALPYLFGMGGRSKSS